MVMNRSHFITIQNVASFLHQVHVHRKGSNNLLKTIPPRILPKEYGGDAGSLLDHWGKKVNVLSVPSQQSLTVSTKVKVRRFIYRP
jgi:hypothetical protein